MLYSNLIAVFLLAVCPLSQTQTNLWQPWLLGNISQPYAAFLSLIPTENTTVDPLDNYTLYVSTFDATALFQTDDIFYMRSPGRNLNDVSGWQLSLIDKDNYWPNEVLQMPSTVMGTEGIIWTSGFLVPSKDEGKLNVYLTKNDPLDGPYNIASLDVEDWSYHATIWHDVNHDGHLDALSARFRVLLNGNTIAELLWLENPGLNTPTTGWMQHLVIEGGPDVNMQLHTVYVGTQPFWVLIAAEFWNERLTIYYADDGSDSFLSDPTKLVSRVVDNTVGRAFDVNYEDLNLDGKPEMLLTGFNYTEGYVYAFIMPDDFRVDPFERHIIASGFIPNNIDEGTMSPGNVQSFFRDQAHAASGEKPYVMVSGDDDGSHYILSPDIQDPNDWSYTKHEFIKTGGDISGEFAIADLDNDGYMEIISAGYSIGQLWVHTYRPPA